VASTVQSSAEGRTERVKGWFINGPPKRVGYLHIFIYTYVYRSICHWLPYLCVVELDEEGEAVPHTDGRLHTRLD
jgi:hypothetical protein